MKTIAYCLSLFFVLAAAAHAEAELRISMEGKYPPFEIIDAKGNVSGFNVDLSHALCKEMAVKCRIVLAAWDDQIPNLLAKKSDAIIAAMSITDERERQVAFTERYLQTPTFFIAKKHSIPYAYLTPSRLAGKTIGVMKDSVQDTYLAAVYASKTKIKRYESDPEIYSALEKDDIDLGLFDAASAYYAFLQTPRGKDYEFVGSAIAERKYFGKGAGIAVRKEDVALKERFNAALKTLLSNGVYNEIQRKYFIFNVY